MWSRKPRREDDAIEQEREAFRGLFRAIKLREVKRALAIELPPPFGAPERVGISRDPDEAAAELDPVRLDTRCALCGDAEGEKVGASLEPERADGLSILIAVWVHSSCLAECPETARQRGVPW